MKLEKGKGLSRKGRRESRKKDKTRAVRCFRKERDGSGEDNDWL